MTSTDWELTAALAVLRQAQHEAAELSHTVCDAQMLDAAQRRCGSALRIVERIRAGLDLGFNHVHNDYRPSVSQYGEFHG